MTSNTIYTFAAEFKPTYLYIKQHSITGLLYFGKTELDHNRMLKYSGSGKYWNSHLKIHDKKYVETVWYCLFYDAASITEFALMCSAQWNIIKEVNDISKKIWANEKYEDGLCGGWIQTEELAKRSKIRQLAKIANGTHTFQSDEFKLKQSERTIVKNNKFHKRKNVIELKTLIKIHKISLVRAWPMKSDEWINAKIAELSQDVIPVQIKQPINIAQSKKTKLQNLKYNNRENVIKLRELIISLNVTLGRGWRMKNDEWINAKIIELSTHEIKIKKLTHLNISLSNINKFNRYNVTVLREIIFGLGIALGRGWTNRADEWIDAKILELSI